MSATTLRPSTISLADPSTVLALDFIKVEGMRVRVGHCPPRQEPARGTAVITDQISSETPLLFDYAFAEAGTYTVTVSVWNCEVGTAVTDSLTVTILPTQDWWWLYLPVVVRP